MDKEELKDLLIDLDLVDKEVMVIRESLVDLGERLRHELYKLNIESLKLEKIKSRLEELV